MNLRGSRLLLLVWLCLQVPFLRAADYYGAAATVDPLATAAAESAYQEGGNAVDAAVAAALMLGVVDGHNSGIGGGCFLLIRDPRGRVVAIDARETAPRRITARDYAPHGHPEVRLSQTGPLAVGTPGALAGYDYAIRHFGRLPLKRHLLAAASQAESGFLLRASYARRLAEVAGELRQDDGVRALFIRSDGSPLGIGDRLVQPDLARTYRSIAGDGVEWFYRGEFSRQVGRWMASHGGVLAERDFGDYRIRLRDPVRSWYRGYEIVGFPPPSSGGVHVAQILNLLERYDLRKMGRSSVDFVHVVAEAMKLAFADRAYWLGDPDFTHVPKGLVDKRYADVLAAKLRMDQASVVKGAGTPADATQNWFGKHTTHFSTADDEGYWVACTATINTTLGAKVVVPGTGVVLNNEMDDFALSAGTTNFFGLVGGAANQVAPKKRPLSSMSPALVLKDGKPILSVGAAGGPTIISQTLLAILGVIDFDLTAADALRAPRFHHQWAPDELRVERSLPTEVIEGLRRRGHRVVVVDSLGACQAVRWNHGEFEAVADPRLEGKGTVTVRAVSSQTR